MENLHLKNLNNTDPFEYYVENTIKQINTYEKKIKEIYNKTFNYVLNEIDNIKIINSTISEFKNDIIENIKENQNIKFNKNDPYEVMHELINLRHQFKKIKNIDLDNFIDVENCGFDYDEIETEDNRTLYEITPISYVQIEEAFKPNIRRYLDITIENNKVIDININE